MPQLIFVAVFRTLMRMERQEGKLKFHYTWLLKERCLQVRITLSMLICEAGSHTYNKTDPDIFSTVEPEGMDVETAQTEPNTSDLTENSVVELTLGEGNSYGIIRWIGTLPGRQETMVGLELVISVPTCY